LAKLDLKADITGNVWKIVKAVGDSVEEDETILVMESMKMEIPVTSPESGVISAVLVKEGETVEIGTVVVRIEN
jgi:acetyl-CoA carboxylase biotin carboxyl carrier protein